MEAFLRDPSRLTTVEQHLAAGKGSATQKKVLAVFIRTFGCYQMKDQDAVTLRSECTKVEDALSAARNSMKLGYYTDATKGTFVEKSSVGLRTTMKTAENEADRKAAWEGLRSIGPFVLENGFVELLKNRNKMAKKLGYVDFYDYKVTQAEGFGKVKNIWRDASRRQEDDTITTVWAPAVVMLTCAALMILMLLMSTSIGQAV